MKNIPAEMKIDGAEEVARIEAFIRERLVESQRDGLIIGLSGGLDSAVAAHLAARAAGLEKIQLLNLTESDSSGAHRNDAEFIAAQLGVELEHFDLTRVLQQIGTYDLLPISALPTRNLRAGLVHFGRKLLGLNDPEEIPRSRFNPPANSFLSKGNAYAMVKHRLRMVLLYQAAEVSNLLVVGAANRTEWMTGTFSLWGCDHCADLMPIIHLYRTQVEQLAVHLSVPERIRMKPADPDILPGVNDKEQLLGTFLMSDQILIGLESGVDIDVLRQQFDEAVVDRLLELVRLSESMREVPYCLEPP